MDYKTDRRWNVSERQRKSSVRQVTQDDHWQPFTIAVAGAGRGIGKSIVASNLAVALAQLRRKVVLLDADLKHPSQHILFDANGSEGTLPSFLQQELISLNQACQATSIPNLSLISAADAKPEDSNINFIHKQRVQRSLRRLEADAVVIDIGGDLVGGLWDFFNVADYRLVVTIPQPDVLPGAYVLLKASVNQLLEMVANMEGKTNPISDIWASQEHEHVSTLLKRMHKVDFQHEALTRAALNNYSTGLVMNQMTREADKRQGQTIARMARYFLSCPVPLVAPLNKDPQVVESVKARQPFMAAETPCQLVPLVRELAERLLDVDLESLRKRRVWKPELMFDRSSGSEWSEGHTGEQAPVSTSRDKDEG